MCVDWTDKCKTIESHISRHLSRSQRSCLALVIWEGDWPSVCASITTKTFREQLITDFVQQLRPTSVIPLAAYHPTATKTTETLTCHDKGGYGLSILKVSLSYSNFHTSPNIVVTCCAWIVVVASVSEV